MSNKSALAEYEKKRKQAQQESDDAYRRLTAAQTQSSDTKAAVDAYRNREAFTYDPTHDGLYAGYQQAYEADGRQAMKDTIARGTQLSGGYGNSYAVTAGQQAYQDHMDRLAQTIPQLYEIAQERYDQQTQQLLEEIQLLQQQDQAAYQRAGDLADRADRRLSAAEDAYTDWRDFAYRTDRDAVEDAQWQQEFAHEKAVDYQAQQLAQSRFDYQKAKDAQDKWTVKDTQTLEEIINTYFPLDDGKLTDVNQNQQLQDLLEHFGFTQNTDLGRSIYQKYRYVE